MTEEKNECVPRLRFPEFQRASKWKEIILDDICSFFKGKGISKDDISSQGKTPCIRYGELYTFYNETIKSVISSTNIIPDNLFFSKKNDILLPSSGETKEDIATAACLLLDDVALGSDLHILRTDQNGIFISYYINHVLNKNISKIAQGDTVVHLYSTQLKTVKLYLPSLSEQQKIADCLSSLDELIEAREQKCNALKQHKKGLMQRLFPAEGETTPRWRFPKFRDSGEWNLLTLASMCHLQAGKFIAAEKIHTVWHEGLFPCYGGNGLRGYVEKSNCKKCYPLIGRQGALCGNIQMPDREFYATEHAIIAKCDESLSNNIFLFYILSKLNLNNLAIGQAQPGISVEILKKVLIQHPSLPEQQKIADCLSSLDDRIAAEEDRLAALREHKKGLMQQLFPRYE